MTTTEQISIDDIKTFTKDQETYATDGDLVWALTPCCKASGKGADYSETGVSCRSCHEDVDPFYGSSWTTEEWENEQ